MLVHIGYHKSGTTWLQRSLFSDRALGFYQPCTRHDIIQQLVLVRPFEFDAEAARGYFEQRCAAVGDDSTVPVLSAERLSGNPHSGGYDSEIIARRLNAVFPEGKVLICFREQRGMIASAYQQYVREGGVSSLSRYLQPPSSGVARVPMFSWDYLEYDKVIAGYRALFGKENVLALPYEWFRSQPVDFVNRIARFAGAQLAESLHESRPNTSLSGVAMALKRPANLLFVRDRINPLAPVDDARPASLSLRCVQKVDRLTPSSLKQHVKQRERGRIEALVGGRYRESNRRLEEMLSIDLRELGYDVAG